MLKRQLLSSFRAYGTMHRELGGAQWRTDAMEYCEFWVYLGMKIWQCHSMALNVILCNCMLQARCVVDSKLAPLKIPSLIYIWYCYSQDKATQILGVWYRPQANYVMLQCWWQQGQSRLSAIPSPSTKMQGPPYMTLSANPFSLI